MGRNRKDGDPFGLAGTRLAFKRDKFWYRHRGAPERWECVGADIAIAKQRAGLYNDPGNAYGTTRYWLDMFVADCEQRQRKSLMSARTVADYRGYLARLKPAFGAMLPEHITPHDVQKYLRAGEEDGRAVQANRERACLSSMLSWLIRNGETTLRVNPCMRQSGVVRNTESKRERYVTHEEYRAVFNAGSPSVKLMMALVYRTLQRPEVDVLGWTARNIVRKGDGDTKVLRNKQSKTGRTVDVALVGELAELVRVAMGEVPVLHQPLVHNRKGEAYTYDGISTMLKKAQTKVRAAGGALATMPSFGYRDLKGKGATDMWLSGEPIERIQLLCGHSDKTTTEKYIKARWRETAQPNMVQV